MTTHIDQDVMKEVENLFVSKEIFAVATKTCPKCLRPYPLSHYKRRGTGTPTKQCEACRSQTRKKVNETKAKWSPGQKTSYILYHRARGNALSRLKENHPEEFEELFAIEMHKVELQERQNQRRKSQE